jgi:DNA processing protein
MNHADDRFFRLALVLAAGGSRVRRLAAEITGDRSLAESLAATGVPKAVLQTARKLAESEAQTVLDRISQAGWRWVIPGDEGYPAILQASSDPPLGLFVRGVLQAGDAVAIVGSRQATPYGRQVARLLGEELGTAGIVVVSGMARGVDEAAHRGALSAGGHSWAVWGTGPDRVYPKEHGALAEDLATTGALITEYPPGTPPRRHHFPERNRIIAGLVRAVVVVEAAARSGALITARFAMEEGREVLAVPGNIFSKYSVGPNTLLRVGARPLLTPRDLFDAIDREPPSGPADDPDHGLLRHLKAGEALTADELADRAGVEISTVSQGLLEHELAGEISREPDGRYARVRAPRMGDGGSTK